MGFTVYFAHFFLSLLFLCAAGSVGHAGAVPAGRRQPLGRLGGLKAVAPGQALAGFAPGQAIGQAHFIGQTIGQTTGQTIGQAFPAGHAVSLGQATGQALFIGQTLGQAVLLGDALALSLRGGLGRRRWRQR